MLSFRLLIYVQRAVIYHNGSIVYVPQVFALKWIKCKSFVQDIRPASPNKIFQVSLKRTFPIEIIKMKPNIASS